MLAENGQEDVAESNPHSDEISFVGEDLSTGEVGKQARSRKIVLTVSGATI
jgi:hypothetical protein